MGVVMKNIKDYRENELRNYVIANLLIIVIFTDTLNHVFLSDEDLTNSIIKTISFTFLASIIYIFVFILDGLIPSLYKDRLIYLHQEQLPGFSIFTDIRKNKINDIRFSKEKILETHNNIYHELDSLQPELEKKFENEKWYELYIQNKESEMIITSQRDYLLTRDMYVSTISITILYVFFSKIVNLVDFNWSVFFYFLVMIFATNIVTRVKVKKFALNVIALSAYKKKKGEDE